MRWLPESNQVTKIITPKIEFGVAKYILLGVAKHKNILINSIKFIFLGSHSYPFVVQAFAPEHKPF